MAEPIAPSPPPENWRRWANVYPQVYRKIEDLSPLTGQVANLETNVDLMGRDLITTHTLLNALRESQNEATAQIEALQATNMAYAEKISRLESAIEQVWLYSQINGYVLEETDSGDYLGIPGVSVTLTDSTGYQSVRVTDHLGGFWFWGVPFGTYTLTYEHVPEDLRLEDQQPPNPLELNADINFIKVKAVFGHSLKTFGALWIYLLGVIEGSGFETWVPDNPALHFFQETMARLLTTIQAVHDRLELKPDEELTPEGLAIMETSLRREVIPEIKSLHQLARLRADQAEEYANISDLLDEAQEIAQSILFKLNRGLALTNAL